MFRVAMIQMLVEGGQKQRNLLRASQRIASAAAGGAAVVLLPETMDCGWTDPATAHLAAPIPEGDACCMLMEAARQHGVYICSGLAERQGAAVYNSAILIDPAGRILLKYRKLNELDIGWPCYGPGDRLGVADTPLGRLGVMICADAFAQGHIITRTLGLMGAQLILSPSAWAVAPGFDNRTTPYGQLWRDSYMPPAKEFGMWILGCSNTGPIDGGPWQGHRCIGCSMAVDGQGREVLQGPFGEQAEAILCVDVDLAPPARHHLPPEGDRIQGPR